MDFTIKAPASRIAAGGALKKAVASALSAAVALSGCATSSKDITSSYVSPLQYQSYDCAQITAETQRIQARVGEISGSLDQTAANDKALVGVGMVLFWPALFALGGSKPQQAEFARLKGEFDALQKAAIDKRCTGIVSAPPASAAAPAATVPASVPASAAGGAAKKRS